MRAWTLIAHTDPHRAFALREQDKVEEFANGRVGLVERLTANGMSIGQRLAHANRLASLAGKRKCNAQARLLKSLPAPRNMGEQRSQV